MWTPIFEQNKDNVVETLDAYIQNLEHFKSLLVKDDYSALFQEMKNTNQLTSILNGISKK
jgi:prephenate dehydrogenase